MPNGQPIGERVARLEEQYNQLIRSGKVDTQKLEDMEATLTIIKANTEARAEVTAQATASMSKRQVAAITGVLGIVAGLASIALTYVLKLIGG